MSESITQTILKNLFFEVALKSLEEKLISLAPLLGWPVINPVFLFIMNKIASLFYDELTNVVQFVEIDWEVEKEKKAYQDALKKLEDEINKPKDQRDETAIERERLNTRDRLRDLIRIAR